MKRGCLLAACVFLCLNTGCVLQDFTMKGIENLCHIFTLSVMDRPSGM